MRDLSDPVITIAPAALAAVTGGQDPGEPIQPRLDIPWPNIKGRGPGIDPPPQSPPQPSPPRIPWLPIPPLGPLF